MALNEWLILLCDCWFKQCIHYVTQKRKKNFTNELISWSLVNKDNL